MNSDFVKEISEIGIDERIVVYTTGITLAGDVTETRAPGSVLALSTPSGRLVHINVAHIIAIERRLA